MECAEISYRGLQGRSGKGITETPLMRMCMRKWVIGELVDSKSCITADLKGKLRTIFRSHTSYQVNVKPLSSEPMDVSYISTWPRQAVIIWELATLMFECNRSQAYTIQTGIK